MNTGSVMRRALVSAALTAAGAVFAGCAAPPKPLAAGPAAPPAKKWGKPADGLRCRLTLGRKTVPMGATLSAAVHLRFDPNGVDPKIDRLNQCPPDWLLAFTFTDVMTRKVFHRLPYDPHMPPPPPRPADLVLLRDKPIRPCTATVRLLTDRGEQLPAGWYRVAATYENTARHSVEFHRAPDGSLTRRPYRGPSKFWKGTIASAPLLLEVLAAEAREVEIKTHSAWDLRWEQRIENGREVRAIRCAWSRGNPIRIRVKRRPGYVMSRTWRQRLFLSGKELADQSGGGIGPVWEAGAGASYLSPAIVRRVLAGEPLTITADVEVFETSLPAGHRWAPRTGDYKVLWKGRVQGTLSAPK